MQMALHGSMLAPPWSERLFSTHNITAVNLLAVDWPTPRLAMVPSCPGSASAASPHVTLVPNTCDSGRRKFVQQFRYELVTRKDKCAWLKWPVSVVQGFSRGSGIYLGTMHPSRMGLQYMQQARAGPSGLASWLGISTISLKSMNRMRSAPGARPSTCTA